MLNVQINNPRTLDPVIRSVSRFAGNGFYYRQHKRIFIDTVDRIFSVHRNRSIQL